ncbi:MAG: energy transducer TonB [Tannerellaceae bacterium]|nr:energy transducer TonB [Tannerellaceae bacterium]
MKINIFILIPLSCLCMSFTLSTDTTVMPVTLFSDIKYGPQFPGGKDELIKFINDHLQYPQEAQVENKSGSVGVTFTVNPDGNIDQIKEESGSYPILVDEVLRVLHLLPSFMPEKTLKNAIKLQYTMSVKFSLEKSPGDDDTIIPLVYINEGKPKKLSSLHWKHDDDLIFTVVEAIPEFPGGYEALLKFINEKLIYPKEAQELGLQGKVTCSFVVNTEGSVVNINIVKGVDPILDMEAIRVIKQMPKWAPGNPRGKPVRVLYTLPINFRLSQE